jgi:hypothetical protein
MATPGNKLSSMEPNHRVSGYSTQRLALKKKKGGHTNSHLSSCGQLVELNVGGDEVGGEFCVSSCSSPTAAA